MTHSPFLAAVRELLEPFRRKHFVLDEDCWYTCPAATDERDGGHTCNDWPAGVCNCGADTDNAKLDETAARIARGIEAAIGTIGDDWQMGWEDDTLLAFREASAR